MRLYTQSGSKLLKRASKMLLLVTSGILLLALTQPGQIVRGQAEAPAAWPVVSLTQVASGLNAPDYVTYLKRVFKHAGPETQADIERWGDEEIQHGLALGRWAEMADPSFDFEDAFARFREGYKPPHFASDDEISIRGSRRAASRSR